MNEEKKAKIKNIMEWIYCIIIAVALALLVRYYVGTPTIVRQTSMVPTFKQNDRLILNRLYRTFKTEPQRGEIITFEAPSVFYPDEDSIDFNSPVAVYDNEPKGFFSRFMYYVIELNKTSYIKRVIGLPGEHLQIKDGKVYINGEELEENYLADNVVTDGGSNGQFIDIIVPEKTVFVMGDNRGSSGDSRMFGCVPFDKIEGKVVFRFWPLSTFGKVQ